jgi:lipopolysaccharide transport system ATP-binding protein
LVVDEVLAVGDAAFQKKCLGKMSDVAKAGRTVMFVSHNLSAMRQLCSRGILLETGRLRAAGRIEDLLDTYLGQGQSRTTLPATTILKEPRNKGQAAQLIQVRVLDPATGEPKSLFGTKEAIGVEMRVKVWDGISNLHFYVRVYTGDGILAFASGDWDPGQVETNSYNVGEYVARVKIPGLLLNAGRFVISIDGLIPSVRYIFRQEQIIQWDVVADGTIGGVESIHRKGIFRPLLEWAIAKDTSQ